MDITSKPICEEKTIYEEIRDLKIEESTKQRILEKLSDLECQNKLLIDKLNEYYLSTQRLKQAIVMLSVMAAKKDKRVIED